MKVLVVSPHPDDETLGAGGTIFRLLAEENEVSWLNITTARGNAQYSEDLLICRDAQLRQIESIYGFNKVIHMDLPTTNLESCSSSEVIKEIEGIIHEIQPEILILPDYNDAHSDHKITFDWCYACTKNFRFPYIKQVMTMEILSETDFGRPENAFVPNYFVDISQYMDKKIEALKLYQTELGLLPFPRSIENVKALATFRGCTSGVRYAEAFRLIKMMK